jgi:hypothetical protein
MKDGAVRHRVLGRLASPPFIFGLMGVVVLNSSLDLRDGLLDVFQSLQPVAALIARGRLEIPLRFAQVLEGRRHVRLWLVAAAFPFAIPAAAAPVATAPTAEHRAVDRAAFTSLPRQFAPIFTWLVASRGFRSYGYWSGLWLFREKKVLTLSGVPVGGVILSGSLRGRKQWSKSVNYEITITGTSGSTQHSTVVMLTVQ